MNKRICGPPQKASASKKCNCCKFYGFTTGTCDYFLITYIRRGCPVNNCNKFEELDAAELMRRGQKQRAILFNWRG